MRSGSGVGPGILSWLEKVMGALQCRGQAAP
jgi:hypothetical protein